MSMGTAFLIKSIVGEETFAQIEAMNNDGTFQKIITFAENSDKIGQGVSSLLDHLTSLEQKIEQLISGSAQKGDQSEPVAIEAAEPVKPQSAEPSEGEYRLGLVSEPGTDVEPSASAGQPGSNDGATANGSGVPGDDGAA